tara:strand:- start:28 stop:258 length:231 start_codon:yes stop_codon:yes gene_type:complete
MIPHPYKEKDSFDTIEEANKAFSKFTKSSYYAWHKNFFSTSFEGENLEDIMWQLFHDSNLSDNMNHFEKTGTSPLI